MLCPRLQEQPEQGGEQVGGPGQWAEAMNQATRKRGRKSKVAKEAGTVETQALKKGVAPKPKPRTSGNGVVLGCDMGHMEETGTNET